MEKTDKKFLQDNDFISWQLTKDPYLETFWEEYIEAHPEQKEAFDKAILDFEHIQLNKETLSEAECSFLLERIHQSSTNAFVRKKRWQVVQYVTAACITLVIGFSLFYYTQTDSDELDLLSESLIIGENLDDQEIHLITEEGISSFANDVNVHIDEKGNTTIEEKGKKAQQIETKKSTLTKLIVPYGKRSQLTLSDGTQVWVNSGSVLEFPSTFSGNTRTVNLSGEMYLEVAEDIKKPFIVSTLDFQVKVHGTKFNVSAYNDNSTQSIVLVEGSVGVKNSNTKETLLQADEMLEYNKAVWSKKEVNTSYYTSWKDGYLTLKQTPITEVLKQIERYYNLTFHVPDKNWEDVMCRGKLYLSEDLDNVLETISLLSSTQYRRDNKTIYIDNHK